MGMRSGAKCQSTPIWRYRREWVSTLHPVHHIHSPDQHNTRCWWGRPTRFGWGSVDTGYSPRHEIGESSGRA